MSPYPARPIRASSGLVYAVAAVLACACAPAAVPPSGPATSALPAADPFALDGPEPQPVTSAEYAQRRAALAAEMDDGVFVAFGSAPPELDFLPYAQNSAFRYLTGILEPDAALVMVKDVGGLEELLFVMPRNPEREIWEGSRLGPDGAAALTGIPSRPNDQLLSTLESLVASYGALYTVTPLFPDALREGTLTREQQTLRSILERAPGTKVTPLISALQALRSRKTPAEVDMIRRAAEISVLAHREAIRSVEPGMNEFEIHGLAEYVFRRHGAERPAYATIVGSGPNSTTLHYRSADRFMGDGELLLMDMGASYRGYAADVTRTVPVSGTFSAEQREVYALVLEAQKAAEGRIAVGATWSELNDAANAVIAEGLARMGLIDSPGATYYCASPQTDNLCPQFRLFYMHGLGHGVGLDVHDPDISTSETFQVGSAFTIEPGVYVRSDVLDFLREAPANESMRQRLREAVNRYRDIGVRIEDTYIVGEEGVERASAALPREIDDLEALMAESGIGQVNRRPEVVEWYRATAPRP